MFETTESLVIIPLIAAIIQWLKKFPIFDTPKGKKWLPAISSLLGIVGIVIYSTIFQTGLDLTDCDLVYTIVDVVASGLFYGLGASVCYSFVKCCLGNKEKEAVQHSKDFKDFSQDTFSGNTCNYANWDDTNSTGGNSYADNTKIYNE